MNNNGRIEKHENIILKMHDTYLRKNADYGSSFTKARNKFPLAILVRLSDKYNRLETLLTNPEQHVSDESIDDTLLDLANYCILELIERQVDNEEVLKLMVQKALEGSDANVLAFARSHGI